jgi:PAS domain S-box-containing protein
MNRFKTVTPSLIGEPERPDSVPRQALLLELTPVLLVDPRGRIIYWNRAAEVMYGFTREQATGQLSHELLQTHFPEPLDRILALLHSGRQWEGELIQVRSDGSRIAVASEWIAHLEHRGELETIVQVNTEITDRKRAEDALARITSRFDGIIASAMDAIISTDEAQRIVLFNPAAEKMFGVASSEALGQSLSRFIPERFREGHHRHVEQFGRTGVSTRRMGALGTIFGLRANGEEFPIEASISQVTIGNERLFTVILRDITRRHQAEESLRLAREALEVYAQQLERKVSERTTQLRETVAGLEAFSYSLSHDMRASLRAIHTFTEITLANSAQKLGAEDAGLLRRVLAAAVRMERMVRDVLAFSRVSREELKLESVDVESLILDLVVHLPELQTPQARIKVESPLLPVKGHRASLIQCFSNLLGNAVKFVAPGVRPDVRIWTESLRRLTPPAGSPQETATSNSQPESPAVRLWVEDNGIGIEPEALGKIFDIFQRLHSEYEGTGIGLAIVRKAVERMGGVVGVLSEPGIGSRFWIELPAGTAA